MPKKLTEDEAKLRSANTKIGQYSAIYISGYNGNHKPCLFECPMCNNIFSRKPNSVWDGKQKLIFCKICGRIIRDAKTAYSQLEIETRYKTFGFELLEQYIDCHTKVNTKCHCGKTFKLKPNSIFSGSTKSCGHCGDPKIGDKFNKLTIIDIKISQKHSCSVKCICDCGRETGWNGFSFINKQYIKTCGKCHNPNVGDVFESLTIIQIRECKSGGCSVKCLCKCGKVTDWIRFNRLTTKHQQSCGNCILKRNGRATSHVALRLHNIIEQILGQKCEHNFHIKGLGCIDIVQPELKIAIEYDGYYNHMIRSGDCTEKDNNKIGRLIKLGWKVLHIKSNGDDIPTEKQLSKILLNCFQHNAKKRTITMKSWRKAEQKFNGKA